MSFDEENGAIGTLLHPLSVDNFFQSYWEKSPVHIERSDEHHFSNILSIELIDAFISSGETSFPDVQLVMQPDGIPKDSYTDADNRILPLNLIEHYAAGATLTIARADSKIGTLGGYCRRLQSQGQMRSHANVYLSPPANQGFNPHYDTHDVFILQVSGKKQFNFYSNNVDLPFNEDKFIAQNFQPGEKTEEIILTAGDTLYIPRGITHDAIALDQMPSLHITLGVYPVIARDLLQELVQLAGERDARLRQSIPLINLTSTSSHQDVTASLHGLLDQILTTQNVDTALSRYQDQTAIQCAQDSHGLLARQYRSNPLTEESVVRVKRNMIISIDTGANVNGVDESAVTTVRLPGQIAEFHNPMGEAVQWLLEQQVARVADIPLLSGEQKLALIDKLSRQNIVSVE